MHDEQPRLSGPGRRFHVHVQGVAGKVLGIALSAALLVVAVAFSLALFAVLLAGVVSFGGYFWWKTRNLRKRMREQRPPPERTVEGELIRDDGPGTGGAR